MEIINTLGRRKTSVARVYLSKGTGKVIVNKRDYKEFFPIAVLQYSEGPESTPGSSAGGVYNDQFRFLFLGPLFPAVKNGLIIRSGCCDLPTFIGIIPNIFYAKVLQFRGIIVETVSKIGVTEQI